MSGVGGIYPKFPLDTRPININEHIRSLEDLLRRTIGKRITLTLDLTSKAAVALADASQLESALLNLVINARDALPKGSNIHITTFAAHFSGSFFQKRAGRCPCMTLGFKRAGLKI